MKDDHSGFSLRDRVKTENLGRPFATAYMIWGKRLFDIAFSATAIFFMAPIIALVWCIISLDGGNGFYGQVRIGKAGRFFRCWKLRSMVVNSDLMLAKLCASDHNISDEWYRNQKLTNDPRITTIGHFIRKTRIDELPQLWNVLIGDMSIVGPRPFTPEQMPLYIDADGAAYFRLRPGVTGPWQIASKTGAETAFIARVGFDESYANSVNFGGDINIILRTIKTVFLMDGQ